jgi:MtrB/PioB family decaheme-associated outer membrane protein
MRNRTVILLGALLLASAGLQAQGQQQQAAPQAPAKTTASPASSFTPKFGLFDFGYRGDSLSGDEARYNRLQDNRDGVVARFQFSKENEATFWRAEGSNIGWRDQRFFGEYNAIGKLQATVEWAQNPLFLSSGTRSLYTDRGNGVLDIADAVQLSIQDATALGNPARDAAISAALANANRLDLRSRRDLGTFNAAYMINRDVDLKLRVRQTRRQGNQVFSYGFGTSPGLNPSVELPVPVDDRTTDVRGAVEFANARGLLSVGWDSSFYNNDVPLVQFDNPLRASSIVNGPAFGQAGWWPGSTAFNVNLNGSYKLAPRTRATAAFSIGQWKSDERIVAPTVNTALVAPSLERGNVDGRADIKTMVLGFSSRPTRTVTLNARYRYYDYANKTPHFSIGSDLTPSIPLGDFALVAQHHETEPASFKRNTFDFDASFTPLDYLALGAGYGREDADRTFRIFEKTAEDTFRFTVDSVGNEYVTLRTRYEFSKREGSGFEEHLLDDVGEQPEFRHFDIANRDRKRLLSTLTITPVSFFSLNGSLGRGEDDFTDSGFGLRDNENNTWSAGFDIVPNAVVSFSTNYGVETYKANINHRTANPAPSPSFTDPSRNWGTNQDDKVKTFSANLDLDKAIQKTDIRLSYDLSDGKATYVYNIPAGSTILTGINYGPGNVFAAIPVVPLPELKNKLSTGRVDVQHYVRPNVALGVIYHYEQYKVQDFGLGEGTIDRLDPKSAATGLFASTLYSGYLFRPYTAHRWSLRMTYLW